MNSNNLRNEIAYFTFDTTSGILELTEGFVLTPSVINSLQAHTIKEMPHLGKHGTKVSYTHSVAQSGGILQALKDILNDNEVNKVNTNDIDNGNITKSKEVDRIADKLVAEFNSPISRPFYCKVAWTLPAPIIERLVAEANELGKNPGGLFNHLARKEMG